MIAVILVACFILAVLYLDRFLNLPHGCDEPPIITQPIPFIGHLIGMIRYGNLYYSKVRFSQRTEHPIYTLRVPRNKIYVVKSPYIAALVDRHAKQISFAPYAVEFVRRFLEPSVHAMEALSENMHEEGLWGLRPETIKMMHETMCPGEHLQSTTQALISQLCRRMMPLEAITASGQIGLFAWLRHVMTQATTDAIYGTERNAFHDPEVESGFWDIKDEFVWLGLNIKPKYIAPCAYQGRQKLFRAFEQYYANKGHETASPLVRQRFAVNERYKTSITDVAHFDMSICFALLVNSVPTAFWCIVYLYSRPALLQKFREGIMKRSQKSHADGITHHTIDVADVVTNYPELESFVLETLRVLSFNASGRIVLQDTLVDGYMLKKDSIVFTPSANLHVDTSIWGQSADRFDPERFMPGVGSGTKVPSSSFRAFGGGSSLCPGRYLFTNEISIILTIMILKYDIAPVSGEWGDVKQQAHITASVLTPTEDIDVRVWNQPGASDIGWQFSWNNVSVET